jgi:hypothetical protein
MSQKPQYICDGCNKPIAAKPHLSLILTQTSACGVALPPYFALSGQKTWLVSSIVLPGQNFLHFHNGKCIGTWADLKIARASAKNKSV